MELGTIEVQRGYSPTVKFEMIVTPITLPMIFLSGQLAIFPRREERVGKLSLKIVRVVCTAIIWHLGPVNIKLPFTEN